MGGVQVEVGLGWGSAINMTNLFTAFLMYHKDASYNQEPKDEYKKTDVIFVK